MEKPNVVRQPGEIVMHRKDIRVRESSLFTYEIASGDMRFITLNERTLFLRNDPDNGPVMRGEICDLGPDCYADLSQVLLEYAVSCEGCRDHERAGELVACTGERLGRILARRLFQDAPELPVIDQVCGAFDFILHSMGADHRMEQGAGNVRYELVGCPLLDTAERTGFVRGLVAARQGFIALCDSMLNTLAPEWTMVRPTASQAGAPLAEIVLHY
jgi:hypothetical protein